MATKKKALALIRVSTAGQAESDRAGIPAQEAANRATAARYDLDIVKTVRMEDVSGTAVLRAPEMIELLDLIQSPEIHGVIAREFSRLMRPERFEDFVLLQAFADSKTVLYLPEGPLDLSTKSGSLMGGMRALMAGWERREIIERMTAGKEALRKAGRNPGGATVLPYGVTYSDARGWEYTAEAEKVRQAYHLILTSGEPYASIARRLNLPRTSLRCILQNPIYAGYRVYDQRRDPAAAGYVAAPDGRQGYRRKIRRAPEDVIRMRVMDGLVSEETFAAAQEILNSRAAREWAIRTKNAPGYLFNGFIRCGACSDPMYTRTGKDRFYHCKRNGTRARRRDPQSVCESRYILSRKIEPKIENLLAVKLQDEGFLSGIAEAYMAQASAVCSPSPDQAAIARQVEALNSKRDRILESFFDGVITRQQRDERINQIDQELKAYRELLALQPAPVALAGLDELTGLLGVFAELPYLQREEKRSLMRSLGAEVYVNGYTIQTLRLRHFGAFSGSYSDSRLPAAGA